MAIGPQWPDPAKKIFQFPHGRAPTLPSAKPSVQTSLKVQINAMRRRLRRLSEEDRRAAIKKLVNGFGGFFGLGPHRNRHPERPNDITPTPPRP